MKDIFLMWGRCPGFSQIQDVFAASVVDRGALAWRECGSLGLFSLRCRIVLVTLTSQCSKSSICGSYGVYVYVSTQPIQMLKLDPPCTGVQRRSLGPVKVRGVNPLIPRSGCGYSLDLECEDSLILELTASRSV